jgi:hypothetical protein
MKEKGYMHEELQHYAIAVNAYIVISHKMTKGGLRSNPRPADGP